MPLTEDEKAELVAYLDGELDDAATQAVEAKIATNPDARAELDAMKQTWGMLDFLPKANPSPNFTHRTMERLSLEKISPKKTMPMRGGRPWLARFTWAAAVLIALGGGYLISANAFRAPTPDPIPDTDRPLLENLRIAEKWRLYENVDDLEFVKKLNSPDFFGEDPQLIAAPRLAFASRLASEPLSWLDHKGDGMVHRRCYLLMLAVFAATALWAAAQPTADEAEERARLEAIRKQPEQLDRLRANVNAFLNSKKKDSVLKLDKELHELPPIRQARYWKTLDRYADWLDQLKKKDPAAYHTIHTAPDASTRLNLIKDRRDQEWMESQPKRYREEWAKLSVEERAKFVANLRADDRKKHQHWVVAQRFSKELDLAKALPCRFSDFGVALKSKTKVKDEEKVTNNVETYFNDYVLPYLTLEEKKQLKDAEGKWPDFPMTVVEIAGRRVPALPPKTKEPRRFAELPEPVRKLLTEKKTGGVAKGKSVKHYTQFDGSPNYASRVVEMARSDGKLPFGNEYLACNYKSLLKPMQKFVDDELMPLVKKDAGELSRFNTSEGKWPDYPETIQDLAQARVASPRLILPDADKWHWDRYRPERHPTPAETIRDRDD